MENPNNQIESVAYQNIPNDMPNQFVGYCAYLLKRFRGCKVKELKIQKMSIFYFCASMGRRLSREY